MHTKWSSVVIAVVVAGCASKPPQSSHAAPAPSAVATSPAQALVPPPPPAPSAMAVAPAKVEVKHASKLTVKRIVIARGVDHREPVDPGTSFDATAQKLYAFVEVENPEHLPGEITVEFHPPSKKYEGQVTLGVGEGRRWRTWAMTRQAHEVGEWTAVVRDERGHELAREKFDVLSSSG